MTTYVPTTVELADDSPEALFELFESRGLGDGLPLVPPTRERVDAMLGPGAGDPDEVLATLLPRAGIVTRRVVAINAVLAGCPPETFPVVLTAVRALAAARDEPARRERDHAPGGAPRARARRDRDARPASRRASARSVPATAPTRPSGARCGSCSCTSRARARGRATPRRTGSRRSTRSARPRTSTRPRGRGTPRAAASTRPARSPCTAARARTTCTTWRRTATRSSSSTRSRRR